MGANKKGRQTSRLPNELFYIFIFIFFSYVRLVSERNKFSRTEMFAVCLFEELPFQPIDLVGEWAKERAHKTFWNYFLSWMRELSTSQRINCVPAFSWVRILFHSSPAASL